MKKNTKFFQKWTGSIYSQKWKDFFFHFSKDKSTWDEEVFFCRSSWILQPPLQGESVPRKVDFTPEKNQKKTQSCAHSTRLTFVTFDDVNLGMRKEAFDKSRDLTQSGHAQIHWQYTLHAVHENGRLGCPDYTGPANRPCMCNRKSLILALQISTGRSPKRTGEKKKAWWMTMNKTAKANAKYPPPPNKSHPCTHAPMY